MIMKKFYTALAAIILGVSAASFVSAADKISSGDDVIAAMYKKYDGKWYRTLTFVQKTTNYKPDGSSEVVTWYEALSAPGKLRIDIAPLEKGDGIIFANGEIAQFRDTKLMGKRPFVHPLLVLGFDVYMQPAATTIAQLKGMGIDMSVVHEDKWQGKEVYVVGAKNGDLATPQFWITKNDLLFVRLFQKAGRDGSSVAETQFNKYQKVKGGGWVSVEVAMFVNGKPSVLEEYSEVQTDVKLEPDLWNPEKWMTVDRTYYKKK
jgi:hypothetical protein